VSAVKLLLELRDHHVVVDVVEGQIRCRHRPGALPTGLAERVRARRGEILALLAEPDALREAVARLLFGGESDKGPSERSGKDTQMAARACFACGQEQSSGAAVCTICHPRCPPPPSTSSGRQNFVVVDDQDERKEYP
jgi:hypothetical protein